MEKLANCKVCGTQNATDAYMCKNCGHNVRKDHPKVGCIIVTIIFGIVAAIVFIQTYLLGILS